MNDPKSQMVKWGAKVEKPGWILGNGVVEDIEADEGAGSAAEDATVYHLTWQGHSQNRLIGVVPKTNRYKQPCQVHIARRLFIVIKNLKYTSLDIYLL